ncbi:MAG: hypothetical protein LBK82_05490 [Planctomycetaceae bacterium]|nr:hypothetical protein [Planctomycetaceae bacterium]
MNNPSRFFGGQSVRWTVAPVGLLLTPKRKATQFAIINLIHCRRVRRRDPLANSERSPTYKRLPAS